MSDEEELAFLERDLELAEKLTKVLKGFDAGKMAIDKLNRELTALIEEFSDILPKTEEKVHLIDEMI